MTGIFISYRREDSEGQSGRLYDDLVAAFGKDAVFMDVAAIEPGQDFRRVIDDRIAGCGVLLVVIGKGWLDAKDGSGKRRLDDPMDFVRLEVGAALKRSIPVVPVLVQGAAMPRPEQLPAGLDELPYRNAVELTHARWNSDVQLLIGALARHVDATAADRARARPEDESQARPRQERAQSSAPAVTHDAPKRSRRALVVFVAIAAIGVLGIGAYVLQTINTIEVPSLVGKPLPSVRSLLESQRLTLGTTEKIESATVAPGTVIAQVPPPGERVDSRTAVNVTVAAAPRIRVPRITGRSLDDAVAILQAIGLRAGAMEKKSIADAKAGTVVAQSPPADTAVESNSAVDLVIAAAPTQIRVPALTGKAQADARETLQSAGLRLGTVQRRASKDASAGTVLSQEPAAGKELDPGSPVNVVVAAEETRTAPAPPALPALGTVPDLTGNTVQAASAMLAPLGLEVGDVTERPSVDRPEGTIVAQRLQPGLVVARGTKVDVRIAVPGIKVPDLTGMSKERAKTALEDAGLVLGKVRNVGGDDARAQVVAQRSSPGAVVAKRTKVDITVSASSAAATQAASGSYGTGAGDAVTLVSISPPLTSMLKTGRSTQLVIRAHYVLRSRDSAQLIASIGQIPRSSSRCVGARATSDSGWQPVATAGTTVSRGEGDVTLSATWQGGRTATGTLESGHVTLGFLLREPNNPKNFYFSGVLSDVCYNFAG